MHPSGWIDLIRTIPQDMHPSLAVLMQNGAEINLQTIVRLEEQFLVCRGRTAGSVDGGLIFFLPYDQINTLLCYKPLKEDVVNGWFNREPFHSLDGSLVPAPAEGELAAGVYTEPESLPPGSAPAPAAAPSPGAPALAGKPEPAVPTISARPAPGPQAATASLAMHNMGVLPAKAAMIERLRKKAQGAPPGAPAKPPDQK